jgi:hypothetical protein
MFMKIPDTKLFRSDVSAWWAGWYNYVEKKLKRFGVGFETQKDTVVELLMFKRGTYQRPFLHFSMGVLFIAGVMAAPILARSEGENIAGVIAPSAVLSTQDMSEYGVQTQRSEKPRDQVQTYKVSGGDTLSSISQKFGVSVDTIK